MYKFPNKIYDHTIKSLSIDDCDQTSTHMAV